MTAETPRASVVEYDPRLVEAAALAALRGRPDEAEFRAAGDAVYVTADLEEREAQFRALHAGWFERLGLGAGVAEALREEPTVPAGIDRCLVTLAPARRDEGAELFVAAPEARGRTRRTLVLALHPDSFADPAQLRALLRRELLHVADMLDPAFGYSPRDPVAVVLPAALFRARYGVLWDVLVEGRLVRRGWAPAAVRAQRLREFTATFPMLGDETEAAFAHLFDGDPLTHADLLRLAIEPERVLRSGRGGPHPGERCPLCACPSHTFAPDPDRLPQAIQERIHRGFPRWQPTDGLCQQCADLYGALVPSGSGGRVDGDPQLDPHAPG